MLNGYFKHNRIHQYTWHQNTLELKSIIDYIIARQNSGLKFQDVRVFRRMIVGSDNYLVGLNAKILCIHWKNKTTASRKNITDGASELLSNPVTDLEWPRGFQKVNVPTFHDNGTGWR
jgi:hypothetical protein